MFAHIIIKDTGPAAHGVRVLSHAACMHDMHARLVACMPLQCLFHSDPGPCQRGRVRVHWQARAQCAVASVGLCMSWLLVGLAEADP